MSRYSQLNQTELEAEEAALTAALEAVRGKVSLVPIKVGDVVRLKSEQRPMTVIEGFTTGEWWTCVWLDGSGHQQQGCYPTESLVVIEPNVQSRVLAEEAV